MNYYDARQRQSDGMWHYTKMNDGQIWPVGYCRDHEGHDTQQEAYECYTKYVLENHIRKGKLENQHKCKICETWTQDFVEVGPGMGKMLYLCEDHQDAETVAGLFGTVGWATSSY